MGKDVECPVCHGLMNVDPDIFVPGLPVRCESCGKLYIITHVVPNESEPGATLAAMMSGFDGLSPEEKEAFWHRYPEFRE